MMNKLTPKKFALTFILFLLTASVFAQKSVTGKVTDSGKRPVAGATISVKGTNVATTSSTTGDFSIVLPKGRTSLIVSFVGFEDQTIDVGNSSSVTVSLKETTSALNEIVVTGYTAQKKKDIAGSVAVVNVKDMKQSPAGTPEEALQGRASGLTVNTSGQPGAGSDIRIRGITGFGDNTPLIIVDGIRSSLTDLNMNDIESVQVLKDASAAIYGVAGSNGAIIVTTKKGKAGKAKLSYDGFYGIQTPGKGYDMASTAEEGAAIWQQQKNSGIANPSDKQFGSGPVPVIPDFITPYGVSGAGPDPLTYDINTNQITRANKVGTNWYKEITRTAPQQSHTISLSSGNDKSSYLFSLGYLNQQGIMQYQYLERYSLRANTSFTIKEHIRVGENAYIFYKKNPTFNNQGEGSPFSVVFRESAIIPVYDIMGNFAGTKSQGLGNAQNPYANLYRTKDNVGNTWNITGNVWAEADIAKHLTFRTSYGGTINNNYSYAFGYVAYENAEGNTGSNSFSENASYNTNWTFTNTLNYSNSIDKHTFVILAGKEDVAYSGRNMTAGRSSYFSENPNYWTLATGNGAQSNDGGAYKNAISSWFARAEYSYDGKYIINANFRRDGSSLFTPEQRWGNFPGVSVAWRMSQEKFMQKVSIINDLKLRASYGVMGSTSRVQSTNAYNLYASNAGRSYYALQGSSTSPLAGFYRSNIGNPSTTWEQDIVSNVGFDVTMLNNKLDFTFDLYKKKISGMLYGASGTPYDIVFVGDAALPSVNIGDMQNTGVDMNITYHAKLSKDSKLDITGTFTTYKNKLVSIPGVPFFNGPGIRNITPTRNEVGHPVSSFFGYKVIGIFKDAAEVAAAPAQTDKQPGVFRYADVNGDGKIDADDRTYIGDPNPKFTYGLNLAYSYKNFDVSTFIFGSAGNDIFDNTKTFTDFPDFFKGGIRREVAINSWTTSNTGSSIPKMMTTGSFSTDGVSNSYFISKGSYLRMKQLQIGYTMPASMLTKYGIDRLRVYVQAANLFTITGYKGLDPELQPQQSNGNITSPVNGFGIDNGNYPHAVSFLIGVNLSF